jgi:hypothetical protein
VRTKGQKRYGITNEVATHLFADNIVTAAPGFNAGTGRHIRAQQAYDWSLSLSLPPPPSLLECVLCMLHAIQEEDRREGARPRVERERERTSERASERVYEEQYSILGGVEATETFESASLARCCCEMLSDACAHAS